VIGAAETLIALKPTIAAPKVTNDKTRFMMVPFPDYQCVCRTTTRPRSSQYSKKSDVHREDEYCATRHLSLTHVTFAEDADYIQVAAAFKRTHKCFRCVPELPAHLTHYFEAVGMRHILEADRVDDPCDHSGDRQCRYDIRTRLRAGHPSRRFHLIPIVLIIIHISFSLWPPCRRPHGTYDKAVPDYPATYA
jgi:hypothetical protein